MKLARVILALSGAVASVSSAAPMALKATGQVTVPVTVNGKGPFEFLVDTGASRSGIMPTLRDQIAVEPDRNGGPTLMGMTGSSRVEMFSLESLIVDGRTLGPIAGIGLRPLARTPEVKGIIGADLISSFVADFNIPSSRFELHEPTVDLAAAGQWATIPFTLNAVRFPVIAGRLDGQPLTVIIDTGARRTFINWAAARQLGLKPGDPSLTDDPDPVTGATAQSAAAVMRDFSKLEAGDVRFDSGKIRIADLPAFQALGVSDRPAMLLGMDRLKELRFVVDYPRSRMLVEGPVPTSNTSM